MKILRSLLFAGLLVPVTAFSQSYLGTYKPVPLNAAKWKKADPVGYGKAVKTLPNMKLQLLKGTFKLSFTTGGSTQVVEGPVHVKGNTLILVPRKFTPPDPNSTQYPDIPLQRVKDTLQSQEIKGLEYQIVVYRRIKK